MSFEEGQKIARAYLSKLGWTREWKRSMVNQVLPGWTRDEMERRMVKADSMEEEAEGEFSEQFELLRGKNDPDKRETLRGMYDVLKDRCDLGFFGKRIVSRIREIVNS